MEMFIFKCWGHNEAYYQMTHGSEHEGKKKGNQGTVSPWLFWIHMEHSGRVKGRGGSVRICLQELLPDSWLWRSIFNPSCNRKEKKKTGNNKQKEILILEKNLSSDVFFKYQAIKDVREKFRKWNRTSLLVNIEELVAFNMFGEISYLPSWGEGTSASGSVVTFVNFIYYS